jgi:opine dehydrogenase
MRDAGNEAEVAFAETPTLPWFARKHGDAVVAISGRTVELPTGVLPSAATGRAIAVIRQAFPEVVPARDVLDIALLNGGPMIHPALILMNAGPIEHFDRWDIHKEGTQPAIRAVHDAFDAERIAVREALGYPAPHWTLAEYYGEAAEKRSMYGARAHVTLTGSGDWREKIDLRTHRYMREDIQLGLVLMASIGRLAGVAMPVTDGLLALASAVTGEDLFANGRSLANLGLGGLSEAGLATLLRDGPAR